MQRPWRPPRAADVAIVFAGLSDREESEGFDRTNLQLPDEQVELIRAVAASGTPTVVVLSNGGVVTLEGWHDSVDAIVEGWLLGQAGGGAIADVLFGVVNPSGHLAETIPLRLEDNPSWLNFPGEQGHVRYSEGVFVGYRYYTTAGVPVRYPFGHGLSYTTFDDHRTAEHCHRFRQRARPSHRHQHGRPCGKARRADLRRDHDRSRPPSLGGNCAPSRR